MGALCGKSALMATKKSGSPSALTSESPDAELQRRLPLLLARIEHASAVLATISAPSVLPDAPAATRRKSVVEPRMTLEEQAPSFG